MIIGEAHTHKTIQFSNHRGHSTLKPAYPRPQTDLESNRFLSLPLGCITETAAENLKIQTLSLQAVEIATDAKIQYPSACNAVETLLVHKDVAAKFLPMMASRAKTEEVQLKVCPETAKIVGGGYEAATEVDWATEYCDKILAVKVVDSVQDAMAHINTYGSRHTDCIVTENEATARHFQSQVCD